MKKWLNRSDEQNYYNPMLPTCSVAVRLHNFFISVSQSEAHYRQSRAEQKGGVIGLALRGGLLRFARSGGIVGNGLAYLCR